MVTCIHFLICLAVWNLEGSDIEEILKLLDPSEALNSCQFEEEPEIYSVVGGIDIARFKDIVVRFEHC
jgi:hypothetical protein